MYELTNHMKKGYTKCIMSKIKEMVEFIRKAGIVRSRDLVNNGFTRSQIAWLVKKNQLERLSRGLYRVKGAPVMTNAGIVELSARYPKAVICLLSALQFHGITTQLPTEIWCAVEASTRAPKSVYPPIRVVRFIGRAYLEGIEEHRVSGVTVRVYSPAKTVADLFRFRNKTGIDVAMEALKEVIRSKRASLDEIRRMALMRGVYKIMRPYMEMEISS